MAYLSFTSYRTALLTHYARLNILIDGATRTCLAEANTQYSAVIYVRQDIQLKLFLARTILGVGSAISVEK